MYGHCNNYFLTCTDNARINVNMNKNRRFELRLSEAEEKALEALAQMRGLSKSELVASMIVRAAKRARVYETD